MTDRFEFPPESRQMVVDKLRRDLALNAVRG